MGKIIKFTIVIALGVGLTYLLGCPSSPLRSDR